MRYLYRSCIGGEAGESILLIVYFMKIRLINVRLAALPLALAAVFPSSAFAQATPQNLIQPVSELKETRVTATRFSEPDTALAFGVSVITAAEIKNAGVSTVNEAVSKLLGVPARLDFFGSGNSTLDLRGFGSTANSNQVIVLDGLRLNEADLSSPSLSGIAIDSIERIEVLRGNGAVLYGEGATGGVIVITTKSGKGAERKNSAQLSASVGSYGLRDASASATLTGGGFSLDVTANQRQADNHRDNFKSKIDGLSATGQWQNDWLRLGLRYGRDDLQSGLPGSLTAKQYEANPKQTVNPLNTGRIEGERSGVFAEANLGNWQLGIDAGKRTKKYTSSSPFFTFKYDVDASTMGLRLRNEMKGQSFANTFIFGIDNNVWERRIAGAFGSVAKANTNAVYAKNDVAVLDTGTRFSLGLRQETLRKNLDAPATLVESRQQAWDIGIVQPLAGDLAIFGRMGRSFRLPNADEFSFTTPNTPIKPQTSVDKEIGLRLNSNATKAELRFYRSDISNEIGFDPGIVNANSFSGFGANVNFDPTQRQGVELEVKHGFGPAVDLRANAAIRRATFKSGVYAGKDVPLTPRQTLAIWSDWRFAEKQILSAGIQWVSTQRPDFANACTMPSYATLDARYAYKFANAEFAIGATNLANSKYYSQAFRCTAGVTNGIYPDAGRAVTATLRVNF